MRCSSPRSIDDASQIESERDRETVSEVEIPEPSVRRTLEKSSPNSPLIDADLYRRSFKCGMWGPNDFHEVLGQA